MNVQKSRPSAKAASVAAVAVIGVLAVSCGQHNTDQEKAGTSLVTADAGSGVAATVPTTGVSDAMKAGNAATDASVTLPSDSDAQVSEPRGDDK